MSIKPLVSIVIPAYNHEKYIKETIKSLINQTYENLELIVIDDGSTDSTFEKLQDFLYGLCSGKNLEDRFFLFYILLQSTFCSLLRV